MKRKTISGITLTLLLTGILTLAFDIQPIEASPAVHNIDARPRIAAGLSTDVGVVSAPDASEFVPGEVMVGLEEITVDAVKALEAMGGSVIKEIPVLKALVFKVTVGSEDEYIQSVSSVAGVRYAERNGIGRAAYTPNDPYWGDLWNMRIIEADKAWDIHKGSTGVVIAILDTGVDYTHEDLAAHYVSGGYDWVNDDWDPMDDMGHGTHCAGIAAAVMDNERGVVGVAQAGVWAEKVISSENEVSHDDIASGIIHATDNGVDIISMSLTVGWSSLVEDAVTYAWNQGVLLVAAAGNDDTSIDDPWSPYYPASYDMVIAVSATNENDVRWLEGGGQWGTGSNWGEKIELAAPGADVLSTTPPFVGDLYSNYTGTSMACPHVAGVAALLWSYIPSLTNVQLRERLHTAVDDLGTPGKDIYYGYGRINAFKALAHAITWEHVFEDQVRGTVLRISTDDNYLQFITPDKEFLVREPYTTVRGLLTYVWHRDDEIDLRARFCVRFDYCFAYAIDMQTGNVYMLYDGPGNE